jgi:hypothetical protein
MEYVYIVIENGLPYLNTYKSYKSAVNAVKDKHRSHIEEQIKENCYLDIIESILADINVAENCVTNITYLYIEKEIHIKIYKLPLQ